MDKTKLELCAISKVYPNGVVANKNISLKLFAGEIHGLVGQNGAGKTTLMKLLFGIEQPDRGQILIDEKPVKIHSPKAAIALGIAMVQQNFALAESLTVAENITLGMGVGNPIAFVQELCTNFGLAVNPKALAGELSVGEKQKVELLRALARGAELLILDEPTAALTTQERDNLFLQLRVLRDMGKTIVFITHKLPEVTQLCDRVTVLRGGCTMGTFSANTPARELAELIMGASEAESTYATPKNNGQEAAIALAGVTVGALKNFSLAIPTGAVLGVVGGAGSGKDELIAVLSGQITPTTGEITVLGKPRPKNLREIGVRFIPGDTQVGALALNGTVAENLIAGSLDNPTFCRGGFLQIPAILDFAAERVKALNIAYKSLGQKVSGLSGGNMQKLAIARECGSGAKILVAEEPTRGLDVAASTEVLGLILQVAQHGCAVVASGDIAQLQCFCSHLLVLYAGEVVAFFGEPSTITEQELGLYIMGVKKQTPKGEGGKL